ncbi:Retrovirus-related Pol polyprotein from transposon RE1 [Sesamum angolense]|uniref:Retrovirus-related Pol polyprotein from transposon RE1 n=1 Tax=Sesamum angolense TaxID=2727404 RepID=A0AAE1W7D0_9LAMI|nr:Retrovirus-related Pol polyprotein from transposon RE1 [Sesamum angolense]
MTISVYYAKMKSLWEQLSGFSKPHKIGCSGCSCGVTAKENEEERLHQFVMGLNDSYGVAMSNILCKDPLPSLSNGYSLLTSEDVTFGRYLTEPVAFKVNNDGHRGKTENTKEIKENDLAQGQSNQQPIHLASLSQEQFDQLLSLLAREKQATPTVNFIGNLAKVKEKPIKDLTTKRVIGKGKLKGDLYYFELEDEAKIHVAKTNIRMEILHQRLGHISNKRLRSILEIRPWMIIVHLDTWEPYSNKNRDGYSHFLTIVNDCSRSTWVYMMKTKGEAPSLFEYFVKMVKVQFDIPVKKDANQENLTNIKSSIGVPLDDAGIDEEFTYEGDQDAKTESELDIETIEQVQEEISNEGYYTNQSARPPRERKLPKHFNDYVMNYSKKDDPLLKQAPLPNIHEEKCTKIEPSSFEDAVQNLKWQKAMNKELKALSDNNTWSFMQLPKEKKAIGSKWVFQIKYNPNGTVERYKARLVAKGYSQVEGLEYNETFAPVAKFAIVKCLFAVSAVMGWELHQLDVNNTFLKETQMKRSS